MVILVDGHNCLLQAEIFMKPCAIIDPQAPTFYSAQPMSKCDNPHPELLQQIMKHSSKSRQLTKPNTTGHIHTFDDNYNYNPADENYR